LMSFSVFFSYLCPSFDVPFLALLFSCVSVPIRRIPFESSNEIDNDKK